LAYENRLSIATLRPALLQNKRNQEKEEMKEMEEQMKAAQEQMKADALAKKEAEASVGRTSYAAITHYL
jgi:hypothetical protein